MRPAGAPEYLIGAALLFAVLGCCAAAGALVVARRLPHLRGLVRGLAVFLVATAAVWAVHLLPALLGVLSRWTVALCAGLALAGATALRACRDEPPAREAPGERDPPLSRLAAAVAVGALCVAALAYLLVRNPSPMTVDAVGNHLPQITRWIQTGSLWQLTAFSADLSHATYPQNGNVLLLAATLPWRSTFLTGYVPVAFLPAIGLAVYALARELGAPRTSAALAAAALVSLPMVMATALQEVMVDPPMLAWGTIGALFLLRAARTGDVGELVLAGCGLGLAFGTKWYAVPYVPVLFAAWLVARRRRGPGALRDAALLGGTIGLFGGLWLVRNWVLTGDPVHPARVAPFGVDLVDAPRDVIRERYGFKVSDYLLDGAVWREHLLPAYAQGLRLLGAALVAGAVAAVATARRGAVAAIGASSLAIAVLYAFAVPDTAYGPEGAPAMALANSRYVAPALVGAAVLTAWAVGRAGRARPFLEALLALCVLEAGPRWALRNVPVSEVLVAAAIVALVAAAAWTALRRGSVRRVLPAASAAAAAAVLLAGWVVWKGDWWSSYGTHDPAVALAQRVAPASARVALAGEWALASPVQPAFGRYLDNRVDYVGSFEEGILRRAGREAFLRQLRRVRYDVVVAGTGVPPRPPGEQVEVGWAVEAGYRVRARSEYMVALTPR